MWHNFWMKNRNWLMFAAGIVCFLTALFVVVSFPASKKTQASAPAPRISERAAAPELDALREAAANSSAVLSSTALGAAEPESEWVIYITGAVRRPGVYRLPAESRLFQLVETAGGLDASADPVAVNLAAVLGDGFHVHVPEKGEEQPAHGSYVEAPHGFPGSRVSTVRGTSGTPNKLVDVNRASADELRTLRGIGPVLAGNIVEYRLKNGRFHSVDDLLHVNGIGRRKLEDLRDSVTVGP